MSQSTVTPQAALLQIQSLGQQVDNLSTQVASLAQQADSLSQQLVGVAQTGLSYVAPPPPVPPIDVLSYMYPKAGKATRSTFVRLLPDGRTAIYYLKNPAGWPWDVNIVDDTGVYFRVTENDAVVNGVGVGWPPNGSPTALRLYIGTNPGSSTLGFKIAPRYYDPSQGRIQVASVTDVPTQRYSSCGSFTAGHLGPAQSFISMQSVDFGGAVGVQDALVCEYFYTVNTSSPLTFKARERFYFTAQNGWMVWDLSARQADGTYLVSKTSAHNSLIADSTLVPVFPCQIVL
jgi:hypothetical protein